MDMEEQVSEGCGGGGQGAEYRYEALPVVEPAVNHWVVHGVGHGQPVDGQVSLLNELVVGNLRHL